MRTGIRSDLKKIIPRGLWPFCRFFDWYLINALYVYFAAIRLLAGHFIKHRDPMEQSIPVFPNPSVNLIAQIEKAGLKYKAGGQSVYIGDEEDIAVINPDILQGYPKRIGLKFIKSREISPDATPYYTSQKLASASTWFCMVAVGSMLEKTVISNLLHEEKVAPRVYDLIRLESADGGYQYAFIVQPVEGKAVVGEAGVRFMTHFKNILNKMGIRIISIKDHCDLRPPDFSHNIKADSDGVYYIDIQNFALFNKNYGQKLINTMERYNRYTAGVTYKKTASSGSILKRRKGCDYYNDNSNDEDIITFLKRNKVKIENSTLLDFCLADEFMTICALNSKAQWSIAVRPGDIASLVRKYLYYKGFTRFDVVKREQFPDAANAIAPWKKFNLAVYSPQKKNESPFWLKQIQTDFILIVETANPEPEELACAIKRLPVPVEIVENKKIRWNGTIHIPVVLCRVCH